jgi:hypothetical protein
LNIDWKSVFIFPNCGPQPPVVVCDGTDLGFRRDFLVYCESKTHSDLSSSQVSVSGLVHKDHVYVDKKKGRDLLSKFLGKDLTAQELRVFKTSVPPPLLVYCSSIAELVGDLKVITAEDTSFLK